MIPARLRRVVAGTLRLLVSVCVALSATASTAAAHVGTNDAVFDGRAGPYSVRVIVRMPGVIPGQAEVLVRVTGGGVRHVMVQVAQWNVGRRGAPVPDAAARVPGAPDLWSAPLWLMTSGSYEANVTVDGAQGPGSVTVPIVAVATARLGMDRRVGWGLAALGALLVAGVIAIVRAAVREGTAPPGEVVATRARRAGRVATAVAAGVCAVALLGGASWWNGQDAAYARNLWRPLRSQAAVVASPGGAVLRFVVTDSAWFAPTLTPLIPDHGKLMHLFAVREDDGPGGRGGRDVLAHLHPVRRDRATFEAVLPPLPGGRYRLYADVVHESGLARTLVAETTVPGPSGALPAGAMAEAAGGVGDDAWYAGGATPPGQSAALGDGFTVTMVSAARVPAGRDTALRFVVRDAAGRIVALDPYMGMAGHAAVERTDGGVFVHLHPSGTVSMAAQARLLRREQGDTVLHGADQPGGVGDGSGDMAGMSGMAPTYPGALAFPFAFPSTGAYRVWVQVRVGGRVRTAAYDVTAE